MEPEQGKSEAQRFEDSLGHILKVPKDAVKGKKIRKPGKPSRPGPDRQPPWTAPESAS